MSRTAMQVIIIVFGISQAFTYVVEHPPRWIDSVALSTSSERTFRLFGHRVRIGFDVRPESRDPLMLVSRLDATRTDRRAGALSCVTFEGPLSAIPKRVICPEVERRVFEASTVLGER